MKRTSTVIALTAFHPSEWTGSYWKLSDEETDANFGGPGGADDAEGISAGDIDRLQGVKKNTGRKGGENAPQEKTESGGSGI